jgi:hypothetical protein
MTNSDSRDVADPFAGIADPDVLELIDIEAEDIGRPVGRLGSPGSGDDAPVDADDEPDAIAWIEADAGTWSADADDLSAEEAAVHLTYDPEFGESGDGYL